MTLYERIKENYELPYKFRLTKRTPVIIRLDGKAFHSFTKGFSKPFDPILMQAMQLTMLELCKNIQGATFGYTQSDEISILLQDYENLDTSAWFEELAEEYSLPEEQHYEARLKASRSGAFFDARCFNLPKEEVVNYFLCRQMDAVRNSIQMVGQFYFSPKELNRKSCDEILQMLLEKGIDWKSYRTCEQRGSSCYKADGWILDYTIPDFRDNRDYIERYV